MSVTAPEARASEAGRPEAPGGPGGVLNRRAAGTPFEVHLGIFDGPFDVLLALIGKHKLDITEIALAEVTDEFIAHIRVLQGQQRDWDIGQASEFLLVAATLLDLKASRLLPKNGLEDEDDLALIEARDLLFARLLQYRAFKDIAACFAGQMAHTGALTGRQAGLEPQFAALLPELVLGVTPDRLAEIAAQALRPRTVPTVALEHLHVPAVSVQEQAALVVARLRRDGSCSFRVLVADAGTTLVVVARFLALLELFRESVIALDQPEALGELTVRWVGPADAVIEVSDEFDEPDDDEPDDDDAELDDAELHDADGDDLLDELDVLRAVQGSR